MEKKYLTREEFSEMVFQKIKNEIESRGFFLSDKNFDPNYPISRRAIFNIRKGSFKIETLKNLPGIKVEEWFCIVEK